MASVICENCDNAPLKAVEADGELLGYLCSKSHNYAEGEGCNVLVKPDEYEILLEEQADNATAIEIAKSPTAPVQAAMTKKPSTAFVDNGKTSFEIKRQAIIPSLSVKGAETLCRYRRPFKAPTQDMSKVAKLGLVPRKRGKLGARNWKRISTGKFFQVRQTMPPAMMNTVPLSPLPTLTTTPLPPPKPTPPKQLDLEMDEEKRLVLWEPTAEELKNDPTLTTIEVENILCKWLRPHQREGVRFLAECLLSQREFEGAGAILADDMGLGKTLQSITLLFTLLRQGFQKGQPICKRAIVICPVSLVSNWKNELFKFVQGNIECVAITDPTRDAVERGIRDYFSPHVRANVLIISYDCYRRHAEKFNQEGSCDLLICDEAHRLKNAKTSTYSALDALPCKRRLLLSGTPMQNDLDEFFAMVNFTNRNVLGDRRSFRKYYELPILQVCARENEEKPAFHRLSPPSLPPLPPPPPPKTKRARF